MISSTVAQADGNKQAAKPAAITPDLAGYKSHIADLLTDYCLDCHDDATKKGRFSMERIDPDILTGDDYETWRLIEEQITFGEMPPKKKDQPTAAERARLLEWIRGELRKTQLPGITSHEKMLLPQFGNYVDHQALFGPRRDHVTPAPPRIWRLRPGIYNTNMPRLAERVSGLANGLNVHDGSEIKDYAVAYFLDEAGTAPLLGNAKKIAARMVAPTSKDRTFKALVSDGSPPDAKAVRAAIDSAFRKVVGRAATAEELQRFAAFHGKATKTGGHVAAGKALLVAVLMQPEVMYRQELGDGNVDDLGRTRLSQREIAYALSYALTDQPIDAFLEAAKAGQLATASQVATLVVDRLQDASKLQDKNPRLMQFFREYFNYQHALEVFKDQPEGGKHDERRLVADLETTIRDILREDKQVLAQLLTTRKYYINANYKAVKREGVKLVQGHNKMWPYQTAFNLPLDWKWSLHMQPIEFRADERAGVLTHPAWLAAWSGNFENHPVQRGKWVRTHLLGGTVPDVPIGVDARVPEMEHKSFRQRLAMTTSSAQCWRCHKKMDPLGVVFERYDHYGRYQRLDAGQPVDASGEISLSRIDGLDQKVTDPTQMMEVLAKSPHVEQVFVRYVFRYFLGRNETLGDANTLQDAHKAYRDSDGSFNAMVVSLLCSDSFLFRQSTAVRTSARSKP